jgi:hypothetical protein
MGNKTIITIGLLLFSHLIMSGQGIPIQLMVVDQNGFEMPNTQVKLRLTMRADTSSTTGQYQEVHITQSNEFGIVSVEIGSGISTTNSQVLGISQFAFLASEPFIKVELDTSQSLNQYYEVGYVPYSYPLITRRAFTADSADYANQSVNSEFADTAQFALNFNETYDGDTSSQNEIQSLTYNSKENSISISNGNTIVIDRSEDSNLGRLELLDSDSTFFGSYSLNMWNFASKDSLYGWYSGGSNGPMFYCVGSLMNSSDIDTFQADFKIRDIDVVDQVLVGESYLDSRWIIISDLRLNKIDSFSLGNTSYSNGNITYRNGIVSAHVYSNSYTNYFKNYNLQDSSISTVDISGSVPYIIDKYHVLKYTNQQFSVIDRYSGVTTISSADRGFYSPYYLNVDTSGMKLITRNGYSGTQIYGVTEENTNSIFSPESSFSYVRAENSIAFMNNYLGQSYVGVIDLSLIGVDDHGVLSTYLHDYSTRFLESSGSIKIVPSIDDSYVIVIRGANRFYINGNSFYGNAVYRLKIK